MNQKFKKLLKSVPKILFIIFLIGYFEWYGFIGLTVFYLILGLYKLFFVHWDAFIAAKHSIECAIWGRPLNTFEKGELKNHKVEIVWRKDKNGRKITKNRKFSKNTKKKSRLE